MIKPEAPPDLTTLRRSLHANPELSGQESCTQERIMDFLRTYTSARIEEVAGTGVLAVLDSGHQGPVVMIRADIDALPIAETNTFSHRSVREGVAHKCGHDGHTTILLGLAHQLSGDHIPRGKVLLLFQPAEETGKGAKMVLADPAFKDRKIDYVFALHNLPGFPLHKVIVKEKHFTSHVISAIIQLHGKTTHAARPEEGINPSATIAHILQYAEAQTHHDPTSEKFFLATPVFATLGQKAYGTAAGYGEVHLTLRCWSSAYMENRKQDLVQYVHALCQKADIKEEIHWVEEFFSTVNHVEAVGKIVEAARGLGLRVEKTVLPFKWGEDFGLFTQRYPGAMFGLGAGEDARALHHSDYDFPDALIDTGIDMFYSIIHKII